MKAMRLMMTMLLWAAALAPGIMAAGLSMYPGPARAQLVDLELILAVDISGSVDEEEAELQRAGYVAALMDKAVIRAIQSGRRGRIALTYVEWAGDYFRSTLVDWTVIDGAEAARAFARRLAKIPLNVQMWTSISGAIDYGLERFNFNPYRGRRRVLDISGDGPNNDGGPANLARDRAVEAICLAWVGVDLTDNLQAGPNSRANHMRHCRCTDGETAAVCHRLRPDGSYGERRCAVSLPKYIRDPLVATPYFELHALGKS